MQKLKEWIQKVFKKDGSQGFTLIEVVIVLAIAGLIFVIVFLAVQGAQRGRRDNERSAAAGRLIAAAEQFSSNNNGTLPAACTNFATYYNNQGGVYPCSTTAPSANATGNIQYGANQECNAAGTGFTAKQRVAAVLYWSEGANGIRCVDSD